MPALLEVRGLTKSFPGVRALDNVDFTLGRGEVHALLGENGAGKSTLINIVTGALERDSGSIVLDGQAIVANTPSEAQRAGIAAVHQEAPLLLNLSVAENLYFGREPTRWGIVRQHTLAANAIGVLAGYGLAIDVTRPLGSYSLAVQQLVSIARAVDLSARVLVLDEPTASLDTAEVATLFRTVRELATRGLGIIFITHFLDQVYTLAERVTILRNGKRVGESALADLPRRDLVALMLGRELQEAEARHLGARAADEAPIVRVKGLSQKGFPPFDLSFGSGEVVGAAGLLGSGRTETALLMFGAARADAGVIEVRGRTVRIASPRNAIAAGFGMLPEDRKRDGIIGALSIRENILLALQARRGWLKPLSRKAQDEIAERFIKLIDIRTPDAEKPIEQLSGGNQQKALLARWLATEPLLMMLDEPTRGVDVGAHAEILKLIESMRESGMAVYVISSEIDELVAIAHRVSVMRDRRQACILDHRQINADAIMSAIAEAGAPS